MAEYKIAPSLDRNLFFANFQGMEDLANETIASFLSTLPSLISAVEKSIRSKNPSTLEISAHTLKGAISNFYAEPSKLLAFKLEQMGHSQVITGADKVFAELKIELERLSADLNALLGEGKAA